MPNVLRRIIAILGILVGIVIIIIGVETTNTYIWKTDVGDGLRFGADFYTEIYEVTSEVGHAVNNNTAGLEHVCEAIGWLIVSIGAIDILAFAYLLCAPEQKTYKKVFCSDEKDFANCQQPNSEPIYVEM